MKALSIGTRLTAWYSLVLALSLGLFGALAYFAMKQSIRATVDAELHQRIQAVRDIIHEDAPEGLAALQDEFRELSDSQGSAARLRVAYEGGRIIFASPDMQSAVASPRAQTESHPFIAHLGGSRFRFLREALQVDATRYDVEVGESTRTFDASLERFRVLLYFAGPLFLILAALGGYWLSRRALAPVDEITRAARTIGAQDLSRRLVVPHTSDEMERLADTLNEMLARLEGAFRRVTQFTADASHELRTPVSIMRTSAEISLRKPRTESEYRETLSRILAESEKLSQLIEQLLLLARADSASASLPLQRTDLAAAVRNACDATKVLADAKQLNFLSSIPSAPLWVMGDAAALERLFTILLDNAVKYTPGGGQVEVRAGSNDGFATAAVSDTGPGIPSADVPHVFDRFYRADRSRSRESGGTGLGLAIGRWIAEAHGGEVRLANTASTGSTFEVKIPLSRD